MTPRASSFTLLILGTLAVPAFAQNAAAVCETISTSDDRLACVRVAAGHWLAPAAIELCSNLTYGEDRVGCVSAAVDKNYAPEEINTCTSFSIGADRVKCMAAAGRRPAPDTDGDDDRPRRRERRNRDRSRGRLAERYDSTFGVVEVSTDGDTLEGTYPQGTLRCDRDKSRFTCTWREGSKVGRAFFRLQSDGSLVGRWGNHESDSDGGEWVMTPQ